MWRMDRCWRNPVSDESSKSNGVQRDGKRRKECEIKIQCVCGKSAKMERDGQQMGRVNALEGRRKQCSKHII